MVMEPESDEEGWGWPSNNSLNLFTTYLTPITSQDK